MIPVAAVKRCWFRVYNGAASVVGFKTSFFVGSKNGHTVVFQMEVIISHVVFRIRNSI